MVQVSSVNFTSTNPNTRSKTENAAAGVGAAGATAAYASQRAASNGVWATVGNSASKATQISKETALAIRKSSEHMSKFKKLIELFKYKKAQYIGDFTKLASRVKNMKYVGAVLNNPITQKVGAAFSGVMAFFVLVPSVMNMVDTASQIANN